MVSTSVRRAMRPANPIGQRGDQLSLPCQGHLVHAQLGRPLQGRQHRSIPLLIAWITGSFIFLLSLLVFWRYIKDVTKKKFYFCPTVHATPWADQSYWWTMDHVFWLLSHNVFLFPQSKGIVECVPVLHMRLFRNLLNTQRRKCMSWLYEVQ
jgi:hypothetical protein